MAQSEVNHAPVEYESRLSPRMRLLVDAGLALCSEQEVHALFERFTETAARLVDAKYGALLIEDSGLLVKFVTYGIPEEQAKRIGDLPTRTGLHGHLLREGRTLIIDDLGTDPRVKGFPQHHPVMHTFLGVPIRLRGMVAGELFLTDKVGGGPFDARDAELTEVLAAYVGLAYWNARTRNIERQSVARNQMLQKLRRHRRFDQAVRWSAEWAREEERARLAREFHDGLGQLLTSIVLFAKDIEEAAPEALGAQTAELRQLAERTLRDTRALAQDLRPFELEHLGLIPALERLVERMGRRFDLAVDFAASPMRRLLTPAVETMVYRIVQEALTNIGKHAGARCASVTVTAYIRRLIVVIEDDGRGFDVERVLESGPLGEHLGLADMRERARYLGGKLTVESRPGEGTMVRLAAPNRSMTASRAQPAADRWATFIPAGHAHAEGAQEANGDEGAAD